MRSFVFCFTALCFTPTLDAKESEPTKMVKAPLAETLPFSRETTTEIEFSYIGLDSQPEVQIVTNRQNVSEFPGGILDVVKGDWNSDGEEDFAVLTESDLNGVGGVTANLSIYERYPEAEVQHVLTVENFFLAWGHSHLVKSSDTSFRVGYGNINGRGNWRNEMTIAYRNGTYVVGGYTSDAGDGMTPEKAFFCDVNLLTGDYEIIEGRYTAHQTIKSGRSQPAWFPLNDLATQLDNWGQYSATVCKAVRGAY
jgi:hypothetical protein